MSRKILLPWKNCGGYFAKYAIGTNDWFWASIISDDEKPFSGWIVRVWNKPFVGPSSTDIIYGSLDEAKTYADRKLIEQGWEILGDHMAVLL